MTAAVRAPHRTRNRQLAVSLVGWAMLGIAVLLPDGLPMWVAPTCAVVGFHVGLILAVLALQTHAEARTLDRMRRGEGVLATWTVDPARWALFVEHARQLAAAPGARGSMLALPATPPASGYAVTVSEDAIRVEEEFAPMRRDAMVYVAGAVLEFRQLVQVGRSMAWWTYRVPIAEGAERDAERVAAHYAAARARLTRPARKLWALAGVVAALALVVLLIARLTAWR